MSAPGGQGKALVRCGTTNEGPPSTSRDAFGHLPVVVPHAWVGRPFDRALALLLNSFAVGTHCLLLTACYLLRATYCGLLTAGYLLRATYCGLRNSDFSLLTTCSTNLGSASMQTSKPGVASLLIRNVGRGGWACLSLSLGSARHGRSPGGAERHPAPNVLAPGAMDGEQLRA